MKPIITSILDTDLYKLTMMQAILHARQLGVKFADIQARYALKFRDDPQIDNPLKFCNRVEEQIRAMSEISLSDDETAFLVDNCPFLEDSFVDILQEYRFNSREVFCGVENDGTFILEVSGPWWRTVLWEVPLMAIVSELYFALKGLEPDDQWLRRLSDKSAAMDNANLTLADFGTRRRFSYAVHDQVVGHLTGEMSTFNFVGTSNVHLAHKHKVRPIGTHAHEWFMGIAAMFGYRLANRIALRAWSDEFGGSLGIALSDTFTSKAFFQDFDPYFAKLFDGVRQDSGDPFKFADLAIKHYNKLGIDPKSKTIIFSDSLTDERAIALKQYCEGRIRTAFGIGTYLTNDCGHKPLNMVIKLTGIRYNGRVIPCVKLSDSPGKYTGNPQEVALCKSMLGLE